jgi:hypothetical protein
MNRILRQPPGMISLRGITAFVLPRDSAAIAEIGSRAVFFTYGLRAGKMLGVQEVKRIAVGSDSAVDRVQQRLAKADSDLVDSTIVAGAADADAVVLVRIDSVTQVSVVDSLASLGSEHTPAWRIANAGVRKVYRGSQTLVGRNVPTLFDKSGTTLRQNSPKLDTGVGRILWIRRLSLLPPALRAGIDTTGLYFVLEAKDARPASDSNRVAHLLPP